jgi:hypothetical protein
MRVDGIGELSDHALYWRLTYDRCGHVQDFARVGLAEADSAVIYVRRHYARCLTCGPDAPPPGETPDTHSHQVRVVLNPDELAVTIAALRSVDQPALAERLAAILQQITSAG